MLQLPSRIDQISFQNKKIYLKRDDLIHGDFSGNKARKFHYFLDHDFHDIKKIISYGSNQSNAMYSMSVLASLRGWEFEFYVDHLPAHLIANPHGNYLAALENGMQLYIGKIPEVQEDKDILFIQEGGRQAEAEYGLAILANEIIDWSIEQEIEKLNIFLPSGTGTTALYLSKVLVDKGYAKLKVFTNACVGGDIYLKKQFDMLEDDDKYHPKILSLEKKHHFGKLYKENYKIWLELRQQTGVEFDLLYDPLGWRTVMAHENLFDSPFMYIHQGGVLGNESMLPRYERKYKNTGNK